MWGPPGARGPGARAPMAPLLIRHWVPILCDDNIHYLRNEQRYSVGCHTECQGQSLIARSSGQVSEGYGELHTRLQGYSHVDGLFGDSGLNPVQELSRHCGLHARVCLKVFRIFSLKLTHQIMVVTKWLASIAIQFFNQYRLIRLRFLQIEERY